MLWAYGNGAPFTPTPCSGAVKGIEWHRGLTFGPGKEYSAQGQPAETQSSDIIGKCSNQGSRRVSTLHHSPQEARTQLAVVLGF